MLAAHPAGNRPRVHESALAGKEWVVKDKLVFPAAIAFVAVLLAAVPAVMADGGDLAAVKKSGKLRHLGVPYANFVTGRGDGMDAELVRLFARHIRVKYEYVKTDWTAAVADLTGKRVRPDGDNVVILGDAPARGDILASGVTVLPWRQKVMVFSAPTFPTQVWVVARADSAVRPIGPGGDIGADIAAVKSLLRDRSLLCKKNTCLDPDLYGLDATGARILLFDGSLNELAPALMSGKADLALIDMPDAIVALDKWPGRMKIIGPISGIQDMAAAFRTDAPALRKAFDAFLEKCRKDGTYDRLTRKYYPSIVRHFAGFGSWNRRNGAGGR